MFADGKATAISMMRYGIYHYSQKIKYNLNEVVKQLIISYCQQPKILSENLLDTLTKYENEIHIDHKHNSISDIEHNKILLLFNTDKDFKENAITFYQILEAKKYLNINPCTDLIISEGKQIEKIIPEHEPFPMINVNLLNIYCLEDKTEYEIALFISYIAVRSILGTKPYCRTTKEMIIARMFGYESMKTLSIEKMDLPTKEMFEKYSKRYHIDRILCDLQLNWNILLYSNHIRGMYIGNKNKTTMDKLTLNADSKKRKEKIAKLKEEKRLAKEKALQQLNKGLKNQLFK
jgi:hypothetical protein